MSFTEIKPDEAHELTCGEGCILLDVRTPEEFEKGHREGAINIPLKLHSNNGMVDNPDFDKEVDAKLGNEKHKSIICTCFAGKRGEVAAQKLVDAGFEKVSNVIGGMGAWSEAKLPVKGEIRPPGA